MELTLFGTDKAAYAEACDEILVALALMNHRFTWTGEKLAIQPLYLPCGVVAGRNVWAHDGTIAAWGSLKIYENHWNALLITEFATWLSRRLPAHMVLLGDSGDAPYILDEEILLCAGEPRVDVPSAHEAADAYEARGLQDRADALRTMVMRAQRGEFFARVPAADYAAVPEIQALDIPAGEIARMTLREVAARIAFPWVTEKLGAA